MDFLWNTFIYQPMVNSLLYIYSFLGQTPVGLNYGLAIIVFTLIIKLITLPLNIKQMQSMRETQAKQARVKPELDAIKKKYKDQPDKLQQAQMELYRREGMLNPFNAGCLLSLIPWPIFVGLYSVITAVMGDRPEQLMELSRHIYSFWPQLATVVPVNPNFFGLNLALNPTPQAQGFPLPFGYLATIVVVGLVAGSTFLQSKMMAPATSAAAMDPSAASMNSSMQLMMPVMIGFFSLSMPTGLSIYWIVFGVVGIIQQYFQMRQPLPVATSAVSASSGSSNPPPSTPSPALPARTPKAAGKGKKNDRKK